MVGTAPAEAGFAHPTVLSTRRVGQRRVATAGPPGEWQAVVGTRPPRRALPTLQYSALVGWANVA